MTRPALDPARWDIASRLFGEVADLPAVERSAYLAAATDDMEIRSVVEGLVAADLQATPILDASPGELAGAARGGGGDDAALIGARVGAWRIIREIGRGGMGAVYLAERADGEYEQRAALKVVKRGMDTDEILRRFRRERQILATLEHPNIARLLDGGVTPDGRPFLVMEYVDGERIDRYAEARQLDVDARLRLMIAVCRAAGYAHGRRIVHRDIKPSNILVSADGDVRLLDFGIARMLDDDAESRTARTGTGRQLLTPAYASPEQRAGSAVTPASDVYALGVLLHELLTGRRPPDPLTPSTSGATGGAPKPRLDSPSRVAPSAIRKRLRGDIDTIVARATDEAPGARYPDAGDLADDLARHLAGRAIAAQPPSFGVRARRALSARRGLVAFSLLAAIVAISALAFRESAGKGTSRDGTLPTLAVLPSPTAPGDSADAYLVQGIAEDLTTRLGRLRRLRVKSHRAVAASLQAAGDRGTLGSTLGVTYLIESAIRTRDSVVAVSLSLVEAEGGFQVWSDDYTATREGLLALQDSMVRDIAAAVAGDLTEEERSQLRARSLPSPAAYDHFLRGNYHLANRTPASVLDAIREYETAAALDRRFAEALARAAYANLVYLDWGWTHPERTGERLLDAAQRQADRALEIDPGSADVWLSQAYLRVLRDPVRHAGAVDAFGRAAAIDSTNAETYHQLGQTLMILGRDAEAIAAYHRALALEPLRPMTLVPIAAIHSNARRPDSARRWIDSALVVARTVPAPYALAVWADFTLGWGTPVAAREAAVRALGLDSSYPVPALAVMAMSDVRAGDTAAAADAVRRLLASIDTTAPTPTDARFAAPALASVGRERDALAMLERVRPRGAQLWFYMRSRDFDPIRTHPDFASLFASIAPR
jgi:serine/threonine protein kinase/TolB-like protein